MAHAEGSDLDRDLVEGVPSDEEIEVAVKDGLAWDERLDVSRIQVGVCGGAVALSGEVRTPEEREIAESIAHGVRGVTDVSNDLRVVGAAGQGSPRGGS